MLGLPAHTRDHISSSLHRSTRVCSPVTGRVTYHSVWHGMRQQDDQQPGETGDRVRAAVRAQVPRAGAGGERGPVQAHVGQVQARAPVPLLRRQQRRRQVSTPIFGASTRASSTQRSCQPFHVRALPQPCSHRPGCARPWLSTHGKLSGYGAHPYGPFRLPRRHADVDAGRPGAPRQPQPCSPLFWSTCEPRAPCAGAGR